MENICSNLDYLVQAYGFSPNVSNFVDNKITFDALGDNADNIFIETNSTVFRCIATSDSSLVNILYRSFASLSEITNGQNTVPVTIQLMQKDEIDSLENVQTYVKIYDFNK